MQHHKLSALFFVLKPYSILASTETDEIYMYKFQEAQIVLYNQAVCVSSQACEIKNSQTCCRFFFQPSEDVERM